MDAEELNLCWVFLPDFLNALYKQGWQEIQKLKKTKKNRFFLSFSINTN